MTGPDPNLPDQLSAWMDGELPPDQARFLQRRLDTDPALRAQFERWQIASACLRGQRVRAMPSTLAPAIAEAIAHEPRRRRATPWLAAAAAAMLVALLLPGRPAEEPGPAPLAESPTARPAADAGPLPPDLALPPELALADGAGTAPLPSISDFPLAEGERREWPRSPLATDEQQLEAYLVGHNTLMAEESLGGFMPYVDVVAHDADAVAATEETR
jgi:anti-sigma factor RsiW